MTPSTLEAQLASLHLPLPAWHSPALLPALEAAADAAPADDELRRAVRAVHDHVTAPLGLPHTVGGVQRDRLIRWDRWSTTWLGTLAATGRRAMVRVLRPPADPVVRRALARDAQALSLVLDGVQHDDHDGCIVLPLPHPAYVGGPPGGSVAPEALVRLVIRSLHALGQWEDHRLAPHEPEPEELRDAGDHLYVACLTPTSPELLSRSVRAIAAAVDQWWAEDEEHPLDHLVHGLLVLATSSPSEAAHHALRALASTLADERWGVHRRQSELRRRSQRVRLTHAILGLIEAVPPPAGTGVIGVNMEGAPLLVSSDGESVWFGPVGDEAAVLDPREGLQVSNARRLLRARASAPLNQRMNQELGGDAEEAERIGRWVAARLELRALRLLLQVTEPAGT